MLRIKGNWQERIQAPDPQPTASSILTFCRWLLLHGLLRDDVLDRYDRFVITRSDFVWLCPHPPLSILDRDAIWFRMAITTPALTIGISSRIALMW